MAQILNKFKASVYDFFVSRLEAKLSFKNDLAEIKREEYDMKEEAMIEKLQLKMNHQISRYEIKAGILSDYVQALIQEKQDKIKQRFKLKKLVLQQKIKRAKSSEKKALLSHKLEALTIKEKEKLASVKKSFYTEKPQNEKLTALKEYQLKEKAHYEQKIKGIQSKFALKRDDLTKRLKQDQHQYQTRITLYKKRIMALENQLKGHDKNVVLNENVLLSIRDLSMHFGGLKAVDQLSFDVKRGEIFGLIGPNGAGKTTVFNCITKFYKPTSGKMYFQNANHKTVNLNQVAVHHVIKEGIVRTFQNVELVWELNILDNLLVAAHSAYRSKFFGHLIHSRLTKREEAIFTKRALKILADLNLSQYMYAYPIGLPYGILKKIELDNASLIFCHPHLLQRFVANISSHSDYFHQHNQGGT